MIIFTLSVLREDYATGMCSPRSKGGDYRVVVWRGANEGWLCELEYAYECFQGPIHSKKSSEWEEKVAGQVITVSRYTVIPDMRVLGAGLNLGSMVDAFVRELSHGTWMRIFRNVCLDGY